MPLPSAAIGRTIVILLAGASVYGVACSRPHVTEMASGLSAEDVVAFYGPRRLQVLPFTKPRSFDDDLIPDGVEVSLRTLDGSGDAVKAYGEFMFEVYEYRQAAGNHRGERLQVWEQPVLNLDDQKQFWERVTTTYQFQLSWEGRPLTPQKKYILDASFQTPGGQRLFDTYEFDFRIDRQEILKSFTATKS